MFAFAEQTGPSIALSVLSFFFFQKYGVMEGLKPDSGKLATWVRTIELGYDAANPYHNRYKPLIKLGYNESTLTTMVTN